jgi:hypothetical protein
MLVDDSQQKCVELVSPIGDRQTIDAEPPRKRHL